VVVEEEADRRGGGAPGETGHDDVGGGCEGVQLAGQLGDRGGAVVGEGEERRRPWWGQLLGRARGGAGEGSEGQGRPWAGEGDEDGVVDPAGAELSPEGCSDGPEEGLGVEQGPERPGDVLEGAADGRVGQDDEEAGAVPKGLEEASGHFPGGLGRDGVAAGGQGEPGREGLAGHGASLGGAGRVASLGCRRPVTSRSRRTAT
jgi:hypothetical protein